MCFFLIKKEEQERGEESRAEPLGQKKIDRLCSFLLAFLLGGVFGVPQGTSVKSIRAFPHLVEIRVLVEVV